MMLTIKVHYGYREEENGDYTKLYFDAPAHYTVCRDCEGHGTEERVTRYNDTYTTACSACNGQRVVLTYDYDALPEEVKAGVEEIAADARYDAAMRRAENGRYGY
jgi:DnaJ-class molecular chaperone